MQEFKAQKIKGALKNLFRKKGLTYEDLAGRLECSVPTIKRILGPEELSLGRLLQLCEIADVSLTELEELTGQNEEKEEKFSPEQERFLAQNRGHFAYLMQLFADKTPKQIAELYGLSARSTEKYLIALEKHDLIRVTAQQKVKPAFKSVPHFGRGPLAKVYYESFITNAAYFFIDHISERFRRPEGAGGAGSKFGVLALRCTPALFESWTAERERALREFEKRASFEDKTKDESELKTAVVLQAHSQVANDDPGLKRIERLFGEVRNL